MEDIPQKPKYTKAYTINSQDLPALLHNISEELLKSLQYAPLYMSQEDMTYIRDAYNNMTLYWNRLLSNPPERLN